MPGKTIFTLKQASGGLLNPSYLYDGNPNAQKDSLYTEAGSRLFTILIEVITIMSLATVMHMELQEHQMELLTFLQLIGS